MYENEQRWRKNEGYRIGNKFKKYQGSEAHQRIQAGCAYYCHKNFYNNERMDKNKHNDPKYYKNNIPDHTRTI